MQASDLRIAKSMEGKLRSEFLDAAAREDEMICHLGSPQIVDIEGSVIIHDFGKAKAHVGPGRALQTNSFDARQILSEVVDINAGPGLRHRDCRNRSFHANRLKVLRQNRNWPGIDSDNALPSAF